MSAGKHKRTSGWFAVFFGIAFTAIGLSFGMYTARKVFTDTSAWQTTEGTVVSASVKSHRHHSKHGTSTTYSPYVVYTYIVDGKKYRNDDMSKFDVSTSNYDGVAARVEEYKAGQSVQVFYNPDEPKESLLDLKISFFQYVFAFFPFLFVLAGGFIIVQGIKLIRKKKLAASGEPQAYSSFPLKRSSAGAVSMIVFTAIWCLISAGCFSMFFSDSTSKATMWTLKNLAPRIILLIFPLIGVVLIVATIKMLISRIGVGHYSLEMSSDNLVPGSLVRIVYSYDGDPEKISDLSFTVRNFYSPSKGVHEIKELEVCKVDSPSRYQEGTFTFTLPDYNPDGAWTIVASYNKLSDVFELPVAL